MKSDMAEPARVPVPSKAEYLLVGIYVFLGSGGLISLLRYADAPLADVPADDPTLQLAFLVIYATMVVFLSSHWRQIIKIAGRHAALVALLNLVLVSALWSGVPLITLRRAIGLWLTSVFATY